MRLTKASLCGALLEEGEEDLAVLLARSDLPAILDSDGDASALAAIGIEHDTFLALLPAIGGDPESAASDSRGGGIFRETVSERWADLVTVWVARTSTDPNEPTTG